ncbi:MAG: LLM class flavin-dependent oxidoreductase, partial [Acidimicrobiia bacterium]
MKLGLSVGYWSAGPPAGVDEQIAVAEQLGFDSLWTAEAYGSDVLTPLAWWGSKTST